MNFLVVVDGVATYLVANCPDEQSAIDVCKHHGIIGTLVKVTLRNKIHKAFNTCVFRHDAARISWRSRIWLWFRGIAIQ